VRPSKATRAVAGETANGPLEFATTGKRRKSLATTTSPAAQDSREPLTSVGKRGGRASRQKGNRAERALVRALQDRGFGAERVPLSGSAGGKYCGDFTVPILDCDRVVEVNVRARGFSQLYDWLEGRSLLVVRADRREPLVVVPWSLAIEIATAAERNKGGAA